MKHTRHENLYRIQYDDATWLGKKRPVLTKKAARTFTSIEVAKRVAANIAQMFPKNKILDTWLILGDIKSIKTQPDYWDCECDNFYIHHKETDPFCVQCNCHHEKCPDSRVDEVEAIFDVKSFSFLPLQ